MSSNHELDDWGCAHCCTHGLFECGGGGGGNFLGGRQGILSLDRSFSTLQLLLLLAKMALLTDCSSGISILSFPGDW